MLALVAVLAGCEITAKTASPDPVTRGEQLTFTIDVAFDQGEEGTVVVDELPDSVRFVSASTSSGGPCQFIPEENTVVCIVTNPDAPEASTATVTIVVTPTECGTFTNTAVIPFPPADAEQLSTEQQTAAELLEQLPTEDLITAQQFDEESVDFIVVGCEQPQPEPEPQQPAGATPITQEGDQESEAGEIGQSFEVS